MSIKFASFVWVGACSACVRPSLWNFEQVISPSTALLAIFTVLSLRRREGLVIDPASVMVEATRLVRVSMTLIESSRRLATKRRRPSWERARPRGLRPTGTRATT